MPAPPSPSDGREQLSRGLQESAVSLLDGWRAPDADQERNRLILLDHLASHDDAMWRTCRSGHLTGSALVLDASGTEALFTMHRKVGRWLQMGGHCEWGDADLASTARRESFEESGIEDLSFLPGPVDLDVHALECPAGHPNRHLDVRWLAVAPPGAVARPSEESPDLQWFPLDSPPADADESTLRLVRLARSYARRP